MTEKTRNELLIPIFNAVLLDFNKLLKWESLLRKEDSALYRSQTLINLSQLKAKRQLEVEWRESVSLLKGCCTNFTALLGKEDIQSEFLDAYVYMLALSPRLEKIFKPDAMEQLQKLVLRKYENYIVPKNQNPIYSNIIQESIIFVKKQFFMG